MSLVMLISHPSQVSQDTNVMLGETLKVMYPLTYLRLDHTALIRFHRTRNGCYRSPVRYHVLP